MKAKRIVLAGALLGGLVTGCLFVPDRRGEAVYLAPPLPPVVVFDSEPYYVQAGYHYHYNNSAWYYSRSRGGPWSTLPRDRYPREVRFKDRGSGHEKGQVPGHQGR